MPGRERPRSEQAALRLERALRPERARLQPAHVTTSLLVAALLAAVAKHRETEQWVQAAEPEPREVGAQLEEALPQLEEALPDTPVTGARGVVQRRSSGWAPVVRAKRHATARSYNHVDARTASSRR